MKKIFAILLSLLTLLSCGLLSACTQNSSAETSTEETTLHRPPMGRTQSRHPPRRSRKKAELGLTAEVKPATDFTAKANAAVYDELDFDDKQEYEFATRGLIDAPETLELKDEDGKILWSQEAYAFLDDYEKAPDSVNPSLWENTKNNHAYGLF